jgi:hypothetical protein
MTKKHFLALARALSLSAKDMTPFAFEQLLLNVSSSLEGNFPAFRRQAFFDAVKVNTPKRAVTTLEPK